MRRSCRAVVLLVNPYRGNREDIDHSADNASDGVSRFPFAHTSAKARPRVEPTLDWFQKMGKTPGVPTAADLEQMLRKVGLRVTRPRVAVLGAVHHHAHADTESILDATREELGEVSHQAVYDVLRALTTAGLVRRIQPPGSVARYESRVGDNHHHVVCRTCGVIADVDCAVGDTPCLTASDDHGFAIDEAEVVYWGLCPDCATQPHPTARQELDRRV
jgi:Fur family transcriptional regulator, stress-responsive regulator